MTVIPSAQPDRVVDSIHAVGNTTRPACAADIGDTVTLECPVNYTSSWRRDNEAVCDNSTCTLPSIRTNDLGLYTCGGGNEVVLIQGIYNTILLIVKSH